ncbi:hypothetical protein ACGFIU_15940 [Rhodococcus oryzae]|uniref:hypothetical protein n=1 Tax=Rhodococcus oryzae TaxID=2571143 RepID=UPI00371E05C8
MRRVASVVLASALLAGGIAVGSGTAVASQPDGYTDVYNTVENIHVSKRSGPSYSHPRKVYIPAGGEITISNSFNMVDGPEQRLTRITDHGPAGFEYVPGSAKVRADGTEAVPATLEVGDGSVSVTAPGAGWLLAPGDPALPNPARVSFSVTYRAPQSAPTGVLFDFGSLDAGSDTGVTFDVAGHEGSLGWNTMGLRVIIGTESDPFA